MTYCYFACLSQTEKLVVIRRRAVALCERLEDDYLYRLNSLNGFYIEVQVFIARTMESLLPDRRGFATRYTHRKIFSAT